MRRALLIAVPAFASCLAAAAEPEPAHEIEISADVPSVTIAPRRPGRLTMRLPSLTYVLTVTAECDENWQPNSVSISVADSSVSFDADRLQEGATREFELRVPSDQIAPLRLESFCMKDNVINTEQGGLTIPAVLSAQASLRCQTGSAQSIRYVIKPLDVRLECELP